MEVSRVGDHHLAWGESLVWDERRGRLCFVDCATASIHWLEGGEGPLHTFTPPSMAAGLVPTEDGRLVAVLDDGLHVVDLDAGSSELLSPFPEEIGGRCNDACADLAGNLITGKLNLGPDEGSTWWFSATDGWRLVDPDISNTNGPAVGSIGGEVTLIVGDTSAHYFAYAYEPETGAVGPRSLFGDTTELEGGPDGSTLDADGRLWAALFGGGQLACFGAAGLERTVQLPVVHPTDVTFGGPNLDRLYLVSVDGDPSGGQGLDGALLVIDGLGATGRPEPRFRLS